MVRVLPDALEAAEMVPPTVVEAPVTIPPTVLLFKTETLPLSAMASPAAEET